MIELTKAEKARRCRVCAKPRGKSNAASGWEMSKDGEGDDVWCCPDCPKSYEPIRRMERANGVRYRVTVDTAPEGQPRKQTSKMFDSVAEARAFVEDTRARVKSGTYSDATVAALAVRWLDSLVDAGMRPVTVQGYKTAVRPVLARIGDAKVTEVRTRDIQEFVSWAIRQGGATGKPLSPRSVKYALTSASQMFGFAVIGGIIESNPVVKDVFRGSKKQTKSAGTHYWTRSEVDVLRNVADGDPMAAMFRLSLAGVTRSEVHGLTWDAIDLDAGTVTIKQGRVALHGGMDSVGEPKTDQRWRTLPIEVFEPGTVALLRSLKATQAADRLRAGTAWQDSGYVLVDAVGRPEHPERYSERFRRLAKAAELPPIKLHALRHSLAHHFDAIGVPPSAGAAWLGHTTAVYLGTYFPERGQSGIQEVAQRMAEWRASA